jgi:protein-disulfide isomerase
MIAFLPRPVRMLALAGAALISAAVLPAQAQTAPVPRAQVEAIIKDYLVKNPDVLREALFAHPEVLRDALVEMDRKQKEDEESARTKAVADQAPLIFNSPRQAVIGNPNGKVTLVEFFDYNCGYCKKSLDDLAKLIKTDPDLRVVIKDFPVLGPGSVEAAEVATALRGQFSGEKYWQYHQKLLSSRGQVGKTQALAVAKELGADMDKLQKDLAKPDVKASIQEVMQIADSLQLTGTPSFVMGNDVVVGAVGYDEIRSRLDNVRKCGRSACG